MSAFSFHSSRTIFAAQVVDVSVVWLLVAPRPVAEAPSSVEAPTILR